ncbi:MAG: DNA-binding transcriptional LysR family regulator [Ascidiaceihabitans sp.]|jgi:DNA-binding transcriptional LysR family regulator|tara:strand:- start:2411 stop:3283 length:873 start_codon:yes stop_codon:yes gene_type:complete
MNLSELRTFLTIVETGSLVRASHILSVTQSTVTARLKSLEEEIGQVLIIRNKSGATMTAAGVRLHRYADTISELWQQAKQETALPDGMSGICNLACEYDLWSGLGQQLFQTLQTDQPQIAVSVWIGSAAEVSGWLEQGKSDLGLTYRSSVAQRQGQIELGGDDLVLVSTQKEGSLRSDPDYIYVEAGEPFGRAHAAAFADTKTTRISFGTATLGIEHLLKFGGSAYLPQRIVTDAVNKGQLFLQPEPIHFQRRVYLTYNQSAHATWGWFDEATKALMTSDRPPFPFDNAE